VRVLVVSEDVAERLRAVSAMALHIDDPIEVVEASSGDEARRLLAEDAAFDVLVVDGDLQPRGGFALLYELRSRAELAGTAAPPSVVLASREQDRWLARWAGANDVVFKPVDPFALADRVVGVRTEALAPYGDAASTREQVAAATRRHG
jgi:DNA-binding response OmpR family regulator